MCFESGKMNVSIIIEHTLLLWSNSSLGYVCIAMYDYMRKLSYF